MRQVSKSGTDVNLTGLFAVYKDFEPSMVMTIIPPSRKAIFKVRLDMVMHVSRRPNYRLNMVYI